MLQSVQFCYSFSPGLYSELGSVGYQDYTKYLNTVRTE